MTIKDIAALCGVSVTTVSRVINNHPYVKEDVRRRVLQVMEEVHFVRHADAVALVKPEQNSIGLVVRGTANPFFGELIPLIEREILRSGHTFVVRQIHSADDELATAAEMAKSRSLKGIILLGGRYDYTPESVAPLRIPFVCCTYSNTFGTLDRNSFSSVSMNDIMVGRLATEHLLGFGHRRIAILQVKDCGEKSISELRCTGYCQALEAAGIPLNPALFCGAESFSMADSYRAVERLIQTGEDFTALFAISDTMALAAVKALERAGRKVPEDCSVIGIDGIEMSLYTIPTLTTVIQPKEEIAAAAVKALTDVLHHGLPPAQIEIRPVLRRGESVGPPAR